MTSFIPLGWEFYTADDSSSSDTSQSAPVAGWERRAIQFPRADMSGSSGNTYPENICSQRFRFSGQLGSSDTHDSPDPLPSVLKKQTPTILTIKSLELSLILDLPTRATLTTHSVKTEANVK